MPRYHDIKPYIQQKTIFCSNLNFGEQGAILAKIDKAIYITSSTEYAHNMQQQLQALNKDCVVVDDFDKPFTLSTFQSNEHKIDLLNALCKLLNKNIILISTERLFFSLLPDVEKFKRSILNLKKGKDYDFNSIEKQYFHPQERQMTFYLNFRSSFLPFCSLFQSGWIFGEKSGGIQPVQQKQHRPVGQHPVQGAQH